MASAPQRGFATFGCRRRGAVVLAWALMLILMLMLSPVAPAAGQANQPVKPITGRLQLSPQQVRSNAPFHAVVTLASNRSTLIQGQVEITLFDGREPVLKYRSHRLAVMRGEQTFRFLLPPINADGVRYSGWSQLRFLEIGDEGEHLATYDLGRVDLAWIGAARVFQVAVCDGNNETLGMTAQGRLLGQNLRLDRFAPRAEGMRPPVHTSIVHLPLADVPVSPLGLTTYDVVVVVGDAISRLSGRQLDALEAWVMAGGSICIVGPANIGPAQLAFLNAVAEAPATATFATYKGSASRFALDAAGRLRARYNEDAAGPWSLHHAGLGRAMILLDRSAIVEVHETDPGESAKQWRRATGFLWKLREAQISRIVDGKSWRLGSHYGGDGTETFHYEPHRLHVDDQVIPAALPDTVRIVPFSTIVWCLLGLTLLIGPVDYYVLGLLRRRKFTWVTYPAVTISFTVLVVQVTNRFMGTEDHRGQVRIVDVGAGGRVLRETRLEAVMTAATQTVGHDLEDVAFTPMYAQQFHQLAPDESPLSSTSGIYAGRLFSGYRYYGSIRKWEPQLNRYLSIPRERATVASLVLDDVDPKQWQPEGRAALLDTLLESDPTLAGAYIVLSRGSFDYVLSGYDPITAAYYNASNPDVWLGMVEPWDHYDNAGFVQTINRQPEQGLFSVVSQIAPTGGPNFEDLSILDGSDTSHWLLVIVQPESDGSGFVIHRRLFRE